jgi:type II secretory ATPase GspE/PulE/Tfp pilus assembly ATPase PilB-like protein
MLGIAPEEAAAIQLVRGVSDDANFHTGYSGRIGIFEVMTIDDTLRTAILDGRSAREIEDLARRNGMRTLEESAAQKVLASVTSVEEMHRVLMA